MLRPTGSELRDRLRTGLLERLAPAGWEDVAARNDFRAAAFVRPMADDIVATIDVSTSMAYRDKAPVRITELWAGVGYEPLRRLSPLLGMFSRSVLSFPVWPEERADRLEADDDDDDWDEDDAEEDEDEKDEGGWSGRELRTLEGADHLAADLADVVNERAVPYAQRYASLDALLEGVRHRHGDGLPYAALLAAAGRLPEAREVLARRPPPTPEELEWTRDQQRAARQLERWIDTGGDPALIPDAPPPPGQQSPDPPPSVAKVWQRSRAVSAAADAVKRDSEGKSREELRAMLERELAERGVTESPLWFEQTLDHLRDTPAEQREALVKEVISAGKFGLKAVKVLRGEVPLPDLSKPAWLLPPARAAWPVPRQVDGAWAAVTLAESSREWLDRAYGAIPRPIGGTASLDAWLEWDPDEQGTVAVFVGEERVGRLDPAATTPYAEVMRAAGERDEAPYAAARLTPRPNPAGYLLEIQLPGE